MVDRVAQRVTGGRETSPGVWRSSVEGTPRPAPLGPLEADQRGDVEPEDAAVPEDEGAEDLVLGGGRRGPVDGAGVEEGGTPAAPRPRGWRRSWRAM
jgi:hypothetical protein